VVIAFLVSLLPVIIFLILLIYYDSYKLVKVKTVILLILTGCLTAVISYFLNRYLIDNLSLENAAYTRYIAPVIEEVLKASFLIYLISKNKTGFMLDALIYGFAVGAGFALIENLYYLNVVDTQNIFLWIIRGFGTAVMHGGTTAIFALLSKSFFDRADEIQIIKYYKTRLPGLKYFTLVVVIIPGLLSAIIIHSFFNHLIIPAIFTTILQLIILPLLIMVIFRRNEKSLRDWMEKGLENEVVLLDQIDNGSFSETHAGKYILSLENNFSGPVLADMICLIKLHIELSIKAKGVILLRKGGLNVKIDDEVKDKLEELKYLEKSIGPTGKLAVAPIFSQSTKDLWQLYMLGSE
jgi:protease PrsW